MRTSTFLWLVSTFPPATGAGLIGFIMHPSGTWRATGRKQPSFTGMVGSVTEIRVKKTPARVTPNGAFTGPSTWGDVPV